MELLARERCSMQAAVTLCRLYLCARSMVRFTPGEDDFDLVLVCQCQQGLQVVLPQQSSMLEKHTHLHNTLPKLTPLQHKEALPPEIDG
eukprot:jgi/Chlat1/7648/Chrsp64S07170